jgi:hypothetical protein
MTNTSMLRAAAVATCLQAANTGCDMPARPALLPNAAQNPGNTVPAGAQSTATMGPNEVVWIRFVDAEIGVACYSAKPTHTTDTPLALFCLPTPRPRISPKPARPHETEL